MKKVILDTSFIISCVKNKIDFVEKIMLMGLKILIPIQVLEELQKVSVSDKKYYVKDSSKLALKIISKNKFENIDLGKGHVDKKLRNYLEKEKNIILASLDNELKKSVKNKKMIIRGKKELEIR
ncbi:MAG: hypothetical protein KJ646_05150 [Nanoarchaeota archaeon]|nr:hypothetical protein [Nanoarchaeota archaeon]MBU4116571.1 hypothetical protein [Nanoarchaeota archaeon]